MAAVSSQVNKKLLSKNIFLILLLLILGVLGLKAFHISEQRSKSSSYSMAVSNCYRAENFMRLVQILSTMPQNNNAFDGEKSKLSTMTEAMIAQAVELVDDAFDEQPKSLSILCKRIILKAEARRDYAADWARLNSISKESGEKDLASEQKPLLNLVLYLYKKGAQESVPLPVAIDEADRLLHARLIDGWYADSALLRLYKEQKQEEKYQAVLKRVENKNWQYIFKLFLLGTAAMLGAISGVIVILYQIFVGEHKDEIKNKKTILEIKQPPENFYTFNWQIVAIVFLSWILTQIVMAYFASLLRQKGVMLANDNSSITALSVIFFYLISNGSAIVYAYLFAFRPNAVSLAQGLAFKTKVGDRGPLALILIGVLGCLAAMPIVFFAHFISVQFFGSNGSNNPIISIVMKAAVDNNFLAIVLFYFALGVLAPVCEESLFRGFLYGYLRGRIGILWANLLSSALFATAHFDPGAVLPLFCLGCIFAYLREKTGSILPSMVAHGLWNSANFTLVLFLFGS